MLQKAQLAGADFLLMVDSDMNPDAYLSTNWNKLGVDPSARSFIDFSGTVRATIVDFFHHAAAEESEFLGVSYSSPHLEVWSTRMEEFGSGVYGDDEDRSG